MRDISIDNNIGTYSIANIKESNQVKGRLYYIDFLKCIGLTCIIIAHVESPSWLMMLRNFDVPLMVILSAILAHKSYLKNSKSKTCVIDYFKSRIKRLVIPTWSFLVFYFAFKLIVIGNIESGKKILASFLLTRYGIRYVWIILIYIYSAMLIPVIDKYKLSIKGIVVAITSYIIYEISYHYGFGLNGGVLEYFLNTTFYYIVPYGLITYLGYNYSNMNNIAKKGILVTAFIAFIIFATYYRVSTGSFQLVQIAKYPPRLYYLSYGIACSFALLLICERKSRKVYENRMVTFISKNSMGIYLWHILVLTILEKSKLSIAWFIKLIVVYSGSIFIVVIVNHLGDFLESRYHISYIKYLRG
ncbi:acyltransferase family protein [Butyrivibrio sp. YAB3001]|uniref:acyltransferase family protein n=1 Tax=Butyrivibrio sp. YAB3001 TaxID=1520812 RepID=UPI0008F6196D|nr:acyltransferase [Butyrivibrio sp. YAB3001]SFD00358.1 Fucose 4-O-acetylase [Butyrivibrio sp. YAB3001]